MSDAYLAIAAIANDEFMTQRMIACATQQASLGNAPVITSNPSIPGAGAAQVWVEANRYLWASSPSWGEKWTYALETHEESDYQPGKDDTVITDADILATVQQLCGPPE